MQNEIDEAGVRLDPECLGPDIVPKLLDCLRMIKDLKEGPSFIPMDCFAFLNRSGYGNRILIEDTPIGRSRWQWPRVRGFYTGIFLFVYKNISSKEKEDNLSKIFFGILILLSDIVCKIPDGAKRDIEDFEYNEYTDWLSFLFIISRAHPVSFRDWLQFRNIIPPPFSRDFWILEKEHPDYASQWRLSLDPLDATEAGITGLLLVLRNYYGHVASLPDISIVQSIPSTEPLTEMSSRKVVPPRIAPPPALDCAKVKVATSRAKSKTGRPRKSPTVDDGIKVVNADSESLHWPASRWAEKYKCTATAVKQSEFWKLLTKLRKAGASDPSNLPVTSFDGADNGNCDGNEM